MGISKRLAEVDRVSKDDVTTYTYIRNMSGRTFSFLYRIEANGQTSITVWEVFNHAYWGKSRNRAQYVKIHEFKKTCKISAFV